MRNLGNPVEEYTWTCGQKSGAIEESGIPGFVLELLDEDVVRDRKSITVWKYFREPVGYFWGGAAEDAAAEWRFFFIEKGDTEILDFLESEGFVGNASVASIVAELTRKPYLLVQLTPRHECFADPLPPHESDGVQKQKRAFNCDGGINIARAINESLDD